MAVAQNFAAGGGLVLRIKLLPDGGSGSRNIKELSAFGETEAETLLPPNFKTFVSGPVVAENFDCGWYGEIIETYNHKNGF